MRCIDASTYNPQRPDAGESQEESDHAEPQ
jgi:hypothetical protein